MTEVSPPSERKEDHHPAGDVTTYDQAIRQVYLLGWAWGFTNETASSLPADKKRPATSFSCLRASNIADGSRGLKAPAKSGAVSVKTGSASLMMGLSLGLMAFLW